MKPVVNGQVQLGHILQMGMMLVVGLGAFYAVSGRADKANEKSVEVAVKMDRMEQFNVAQFDRLKDDMQKGFATIGNQINAMPLIDEKVRSNTAKTAEIAALLSAVAAKLSETDRTAYEAKAAAARLENKVDRIDEQVQRSNAPVPLRQTR